MRSLNLPGFETVAQPWGPARLRRRRRQPGSLLPRRSAKPASPFDLPRSGEPPAGRVKAAASASRQEGAGAKVRSCL